MPVMIYYGKKNQKQNKTCANIFLINFFKTLSIVDWEVQNYVTQHAPLPLHRPLKPIMIESWINRN
jgi:hypothetical protein